MADPVSFSYQCSTTVLTQQVTFELTTTVSGAVGTVPQVGNDVTLGGFRVDGVTSSALGSVLGTLGVTRMSGSFTDFPVTATGGDGGPAGAAAAADSLPPFDFTGDIGAGTLSFTTGPVDLTGFTALVPGPMTFSAGPIIAAQVTLFGPLDVQLATATVNCDNGGGQFASVDVPKPPDTGNGGGTTGQGGDKNPSPSPTQSTPAPSHTTTNTGTQHVTHARGTLANTGVPYTIPMTATGAALLLAGAVMLVVGRRRREVVVDGAPSED